MKIVWKYKIVFWKVEIVLGSWNCLKMILYSNKYEDVFINYISIMNKIYNKKINWIVDNNILKVG